MRRVYVRLNPTEVATLVQMAEAERRHPSDQAALLLSKAMQPEQPKAAAPAAGT